MKKWNDTYPETPSEFHSRVEMTLAGLEEREMKKTLARTPVFVFVVIAVMLAATAFAATQFFGGFVDWNGNLTPLDEPMVKSTMPPKQHAELQDYSDMLSNVPAGEYWEIWHDGGGAGSYGPAGEEVQSAEEIKAHVVERGLLTPEVPEGFAVKIAELTYNLHEVPCEEYAKESMPNGAVLIKGRLGPVTDENIDGYSLFFQDGGEHRITVFAQIHTADNYEDGESYEFFIEEGDEYEVLEIQGFDRAMVIKESDGNSDIRLQKDSGDGTYIYDYSIYTNWDIAAEELAGILFR